MSHPFKIGQPVQIDAGAGTFLQYAEKGNMGIVLIGKRGHMLSLDQIKPCGDDDGQYESTPDSDAQLSAQDDCIALSEQAQYPAGAANS